MNKIKGLFFLAFLSLASMANTCGEDDPECIEGSHGAMTFRNLSSKKINFEIYWNYPDTLIGEYNPKGSNSMLLPNDSRTRGAGPFSCWESMLKDGGKEYVYIFDNDSLQAIPWQTTRATNRGLLERREISLTYLRDHDFTVTYP